MSEKGEYKFTKPQTEESFWPDETIHYELDSKDFAIALDEPIYLMENEEQKPLSEVEKAQASVNEWKTKVETYEKELHFAKKNLKVHEWALKKLQEIEK